MDVTGAVALDGTLQIDLLGGFAASIGVSDTFTALSAAGGHSFRVGALGSSIVFSDFLLAPEPSSAGLLLRGLALLGILRRLGLVG